MNTAIKTAFQFIGEVAFLVGVFALTILAAAVFD